MYCVAVLGAKPFRELSSRQGRQNSTCSSLTLLAARGKPSTIVYRAGWLVEPFSFLFICQHVEICTTHATRIPNRPSNSLLFSFMSHLKFVKIGKIDLKFDFFGCFIKFPRTSFSSPGHSRSVLEAHRMITNRFWENSKFHENLDF